MGRGLSVSEWTVPHCPGCFVVLIILRDPVSLDWHLGAFRSMYET